MKRYVSVLLVCLLCGFTVSTQAQEPINKQLLTRPLNTASEEINSDDLEVWMGDNGNFTMGVTDGPILIFGHPNSGTSKSTVRIDGINYTNFSWSSVQAPTAQGLSVSGRWLVNNTVLVTLTVSIVESNPGSGTFDTGKISYILENQDVSSHDVGLRLMIDTMLNTNDGAPLRVAGFEAIEVETDFTGTDVPSVWEAFDSLLDPTVTAKGVLISGATTRPDRFIAGQWGNLTSNDWEYTVDPERRITDSAVAIYWDPIRLNAGSTRTITTTYGLGELMLARIGVMQIGVTALSALESDPLGQRSPNPYNVNMFLQNDTSTEIDTVTNIAARLNVPPELRVTDGDSTRLFGNLLPGETFQTSWEVFAEDSTVGTIPYSLEVTTDDGTETINLSIAVPLLEDLGAISGTIINAEDSTAIEGATVTSTFGQVGTSDENGEYVVPRLEAGSGYSITATATGFIPVMIDSITVVAGQILDIDIALTPAPNIDYKVIPLAIDPNPPGLSFVMKGGTANRFYQILEKDTGNITQVPVTVEVDPLGLVISEADGLLKLPIQSRDVGTSGNVGENQQYIITTVSGRSLPFDERIDFAVRVLPREYEVSWTRDNFGGSGYAFRHAGEGHATRLSLVGDNLNVDGSDFDGMRITRQLRGTDAITPQIAGRLGVQLSNIQSTDGLRGTVAGSFSIMSEDTYEATYLPNQFDMTPQDAARRFIILNEGLAGRLNPRLTGILGHALRTYSSEITLDDSYVQSARGLDMKFGAAGSGQIRVNVEDLTAISTNAFDARISPNVGNDGHLIFRATEYSEQQEAGVRISVTGPAATGTQMGAGINFLNRSWNDFATAELSDFLGIFDQSGVLSFNGTLSAGIEFITDSSGNLKRLELMIIKEETVQASPLQRNRNTIVYQIESDADRMRSIAGTLQLGQALSDYVSGSPGVFHVEANTFSSMLHRFFSRIYGFRSGVDVSYIKTSTFLEQQNDTPFEVTQQSESNTALLRMNLGTRLLQGKTFISERGLWINGKHFALEEYIDDQNTPQLTLTFGDIQTKLLQEMESGFHEAFSHTVQSATAGQNTVVQTTNATLTVPADAFTEGTKVGNLNWSFFGSNSSVTSRVLTGAPKVLSEQVRTRALQDAELQIGIGGFHQLTPEGVGTNPQATLSITYTDSEITGLDEADLRIYADKGDSSNWVLVGGTVDVGANTVTANVDSFWTFTVAPLIPSGTITLTITPDTLDAGSSSTATVTSQQILNNENNPVEDGTRVTVLTDGGTIVATDLDTEMFGTQLATSGGQISFEVRPGSVSGPIHVEAVTVYGGVRGEGIITVVDDVAPSAPQAPVFTTRNADAFTLRWPSNTETDIAGYRVYFDTDTSGTPYNGDASILGRPSPVDVGFDTTVVLNGLSSGFTHYVALTAYDLSGNESGFSSEIQVGTASRSTSRIDSVGSSLTFPFSDNTLVTVAIDSGTVGQDSVTVTYFGATDPFPFEFSGFNAPLLYLEVTTSLADSSFLSTISVQYSDSLLAAQGITDEANLKFAFYIEESGTWAVPSDGDIVIDADNNIARITIRHFSLWALAVITPTAIEDAEEVQIPTVYALDQNYPNPFNPTTSIRYDLPEAGHVTLKVYNILGQEVHTLVSRVQAPGRYTVQWNGTNRNGHGVSSGLYFYRITAKPLRDRSDVFVDMRKMMLLK